jgi:hypothetical protein
MLQSEYRHGRDWRDRAPSAKTALINDAFDKVLEITGMYGFLLHPYDVIPV